MEKYAVTINFHGHYGYIEYDREKKTAEVHLDAEAWKSICGSRIRLLYRWGQRFVIFRKCVWILWRTWIV